MRRWVVKLEIEVQDESTEPMPDYAVIAFGAARAALWDLRRSEGMLHVALLDGEAKCVEIDGKPYSQDGRGDGAVHAGPSPLAGCPAICGSTEPRS